MEELQLEHTPEQWRPFIDSSKVSLKAVLLHSGNKYPSVPLAHAVHIKETYENFLVMLQKIGYEEHRWNICADLKVIAMLTCLRGGYSKFCCFLCEWDSRARDYHARIKNSHSVQQQHQARRMWHILLYWISQNLCIPTAYQARADKNTC
jgi:hypothetical protein